MKSRSWSNRFIILATSGLLLIIYGVFNIPANEGFNPSDDGVILAQSFRLLDGQIPHKDFISIRPVGSGVLHSLHFFTPLPLEISARWFVLFEYLMIALIWTVIFYWFLPKNTALTRSLLPLLMAWIFVLTQNHYNLFPWTTIDALLFISLSALVATQVLLFSRYTFLNLLMVVSTSVLAALCRQTFALPALVLVVWMGIKYLLYRPPVKVISGLVLGAWPLWIYLVLLLRHRALGDFVSQLTGRSELWETGVVKFSNSFWHSPTLLVFLVILLSSLYRRWSQFELSSQSFRKPIIDLLNGLILVATLVCGVLGMVLAKHLFWFSFQLFWLLLAAVFVHVGDGHSKGRRILGLGALLIAWTSSISLGDNAPVFSFGLLFGAILVLCTHSLQTARMASMRFIQIVTLISVMLSATITVLGVYSQQKFNYRDLSARDLHFSLQSMYPDMGNIKTNQNTFEYLAEIDRLYQELGEPKDQFVVIPNAAIVYPLLDSKNPLPVDWMQGAEFVGHEEKVATRMNQKISEQTIFFLIDRVNSKYLSDSLIPMDYTTGAYPYYPRLRELTDPLDIPSDWFELRMSKQKNPE